MAHVTRTVYPSEQIKGLSSTFQPPEEGRSIQQPKRDKHGDKNEDNCLKNVNNVDVFWFHTYLPNISNKVHIYPNSSSRI